MSSPSAICRDDKPLSPPGATGSSHRRILHATSLLGGATALNVLVGMGRTKVVAVLLGPTGVGLMGVYSSITGMAQTIAGCGLATSGVRELATAHASGDRGRILATVHTFRRVSFVLGAAGALVLAALAWPISRLTFGDGTHAVAIAVLAVTVTCTVLSAFYVAVIQAAQAMKTVAKLTVLTGVGGAVLSLGCFILWGQAAIVPALLVTALAQIGFSWHQARAFTPDTKGAVFVPGIARELFRIGGLILMLGMLASLGVFLQRLMILRELGEGGVGVFQAIFSLSGLYAGYILGAMGTDFLPRLSAVIHDHAAVNQLINDQTLVALLLGLPGVLGTMVFSHYVVPLFYSTQFNAGIEALQFMAIGVFGRIVSWPLGYVLIAKGDVRRNFIAEMVAQINTLGGLFLLLPTQRHDAAGLTSIWVFFVHTVLVGRMARTLTGFSWDALVRKWLMIGVGTVGGAFVLIRFLPQPWNSIAGSGLFGVTALLCYRRLSALANLSFMPAIVARLTRRSRPLPERKA